jgi:GT2 family glycosyltransferase
MNKIAVLLTCYNRKEKTLSCLKSLYECSIRNDQSLSVYLVDDGSSDGTKDAVLNQFPMINIVVASGSLFWAGGMRLAWKTAISSGEDYGFFLLLNDDTTLSKNALLDIFDDWDQLKNSNAMIVGSTYDLESNTLTYGGRKLFRRNNPKSTWVIPNELTPQKCDLGNANIMLVSRQVVEKIGILSEKYTHGIADYDYSMRASVNGISVFVASKVLGFCEDDHGNNWLPSNFSLRKRISYLYDVKGLAYHEYLYYIKTYFPSYIYEATAKLWLKTFFPSVWDKFK